MQTLPIWRKTILILLIPIVMPISFVCLFLILLPVCAWNSALFGLYWFRWKLVGVPIPPKGLPRNS
jgi:hypothetical protein